MFATELKADQPNPEVLHHYGLFWEAIFQTYVAGACESYDLKVFFAFLACRWGLKVYLKEPQNRVKVSSAVSRVGFR